MNKDTKIGVVLGLNFSVERMFKKLWDVMHAEVISNHELLPALSDDMEALNELLQLQREYIEDIGEDPLDAYSGLDYIKREQNELEKLVASTLKIKSTAE